MTYEQDEILARKGYEAYGDSSTWRNFRGDPMPTWDQLPLPIKDHWVAAARRIAAAAVSGTASV